MIWNERIKELRESAHMTLLDVSKKLGVTEATAQRYESKNGIKNIPYEQIIKYAKIFNVSPSYIMGWESDNIVKSFSSYTKVADDALSVQRDIDDALSVVRNVESMKPVEVYPPEAHRTKDKYEFALLQMYRELNEEGQEKLLNYADDLLSSNKYIKNSESKGMEESS